MVRLTGFWISGVVVCGCASGARSPDSATPAVAVYLATEAAPACATVAIAPFAIEVKSSAQDAQLTREMRREIARRASGKADAVVNGKWESGLLTVRIANRNSPPLAEPVSYKVTGMLVRFADPACRP